jgi:hypothetical protein
MLRPPVDEKWIKAVNAEHRKSPMALWIVRMNCLLQMVPNLKAVTENFRFDVAFPALS